MTNEERDRMLKAVWGDDTSRIRKHPEGYWAEHWVRCFGCGKTVTDAKRTKTEIRKQLRKEGWRVAVPYPYVDHIARQTVDFCSPTCENTLYDRMAVAELTERAFEEFAEFVPPSKPN
jgi:hypothetical protein